jgi:addiction module HigA family antidote
MEQYQLNPTKLSREIKSSQAGIRQVSIGQTKITVPVALRLAKYFGTTPQYWIDLQTKADLEAAARDTALSKIIKGISRVTKPSGKKAAKPVSQTKKNSAPKPRARGGKPLNP